MNRQSALVLSIIFFLIFIIITYYGAKVSLWSSIIFSTFVSLILLNIFYPPSNITKDDADFTLILYASIEIIGLIFLAVYITHTTLTDIR